jgi:hypothetical protein
MVPQNSVHISIIYIAWATALAKYKMLPERWCNLPEVAESLWRLPDTPGAWEGPLGTSGRCGGVSDTPKILANLSETPGAWEGTPGVSRRFGVVSNPPGAHTKPPGDSQRTRRYSWSLQKKWASFWTLQKLSPPLLELCPTLPETRQEMDLFSTPHRTCATVLGEYRMLFRLAHSSWLGK